MNRPLDRDPDEPPEVSAERPDGGPDSRDPSGSRLSPIDAEVLGSSLAASVITRAIEFAAAADSIARPLDLDPDRIRTELAYLSVFTTHFCVHAVFDDAIAARVVRLFYETLWAATEPWGATREGASERARDYTDALVHPHAEYGRGYTVGRVFARWCGTTHDVVVIECGARAYMTQLPPLLEFLRQCQVV
jgi:hypothetical protein